MRVHDRTSSESLGLVRTRSPG